MRNGFLAAATILVASATLAWSQEPQSSAPELVPGPAAAVLVLPPGAVEVQPQPTPVNRVSTPSGNVSDLDVKVQPEPKPENGAAPRLAGESTYLGNGNGAAADRFWGSAEFLLWWVKQGHVRPLVTSGPATPTGGALGDPGTRILFGGDLDYDERLGGRFTIGSWLNCDHTKGIEFSYFFLDGDSESFRASSSGAPGSSVLARPFINVITGLQDRQLDSFPGVVGGSKSISSDSFLQGAELNLLCNLCCQSNCCRTDCCPTDCCYESGYRVDLIGGFRYLELNEDLAITERLTFLPTAPPPFVPGETITVLDRFETRNQFYGGQIGARAEWWRGRWFVNLLGKVALGDTHQEVRVSGATVFTDPGGVPIRQQGGLLALPTNIGSRSHDEFTVVPEIGINVGRQLTDHLRVFVGYTFLYWSDVVRPGDQIDFRINPTQLPSAAGPGTLVGPARPAPLFRDTDFWAQGINLGLEFRY